MPEAPSHHDGAENGCAELLTREPADVGGDISRRAQFRKPALAWRSRIPSISVLWTYVEEVGSLKLIKQRLEVTDQTGQLNLTLLKTVGILIVTLPATVGFLIVVFLAAVQGNTQDCSRDQTDGRNDRAHQGDRLLRCHGKSNSEQPNFELNDPDRCRYDCGGGQNRLPTRTFLGLRRSDFGSSPRQSAIGPKSDFTALRESGRSTALSLRVVRHLPERVDDAMRCTGLRAGVGQASREETAGHAAVLRQRASAMAI